MRTIGVRSRRTRPRRRVSSVVLVSERADRRNRDRARKVGCGHVARDLVCLEPVVLDRVVDRFEQRGHARSTMRAGRKRCIRDPRRGARSRGNCGWSGGSL